MDFFDWSDECAAEIASALLALTNPTGGTDPLNPFRRDPSIDQIPLQLSLELFHQGTWYEQRLYLDSTSPPRGRERSGFEQSTMDYLTQDIEQPSCITFKYGAVKGQKVRLRIGNDWRFKGQVDQVRPVYFHQNSDLTTRKRFQVSCVNEIALFHRVPIFEIIRNTTEGGMLADLCSRYVPELDAGGINLTLGDTITERIIGGQYLDEIFDEVLKNNPTAAFFLDISQDPTRICLDSRTSSAFLVPHEITDTNLYGNGRDYPGFCHPGEWSLAPNDKTYRNSIILRAPLLYNTGLADFRFNQNVVLGTSNLAGWAGVLFPGMRIRATGSNSTYTLAENHSVPNTGPGTQIDDVRISGTFREPDATAVPYEVIGDEFETLAEDINEIARRAASNGDIGPNAGLVRVIIRISTPLTTDEAERLAELYIRLQGWEGFFKTDNRKFYVPNLRAGSTLRHNAPEHDAVADVPIAEIGWQVQTGYAPPRAGDDAAWVTYDMSFTDRTQATENALLQMLLRERKSKIRDYDKLTINKGIGEQYLIKDCVHATEGYEIREEAEYGEDIVASDISFVGPGPWYPWPGLPYGPAIVAIDPDDPSTYWEAVPIP